MDVILTFYSESEAGGAVVFDTETGDEVIVLISQLTDENQT